MGALAANLSGVTIGTIIMVIGFLKDNRLDQERKRADDAVAQVVELRAKIAASEVGAMAAQAQVQEERERADRYLAELERYRESYEKTTEALIQLLQERNGNHPPNPGATG